MNFSIFDLLKLMNMQNQQQSNPNIKINNPSFNNYPNDAFSQSSQYNNNQNQFSNLFGGDNNMLPLLMSILGKNGDLGNIFSQNTQRKEKEEIKKESLSPKDELLL